MSLNFVPRDGDVAKRLADQTPLVRQEGAQHTVVGRRDKGITLRLDLFTDISKSNCSVVRLCVRKRTFR